jgi:hypothetical protein
MRMAGTKTTMRKNRLLTSKPMITTKTLKMIYSLRKCLNGWKPKSQLIPTKLLKLTKGFSRTCGMKRSSSLITLRSARTCQGSSTRTWCQMWPLLSASAAASSSCRMNTSLLTWRREAALSAKTWKKTRGSRTSL